MLNDAKVASVRFVNSKVLATRINQVICIHGPPTPGGGQGIAVEMSGVLTFELSLQCGGYTGDLRYTGKKGSAKK